MDLTEALEKLDRLTGKEYELGCWQKVRRILEKHNLYWCWRRQDDYEWVNDLDSLENQLQLALNTIERLKEANVDDKSGV